MRADTACALMHARLFTRWPWITTTLALASSVLHATGADPRALAYTPGQLSAQLLASHLAHWSPLHFGWDVLTFTLVGVVAELRHRQAQLWFLLVAGVLVPPLACAYHTNITHYAGLSGLVLGQVALVLGLQLSALLRRGRLVAASCLLVVMLALLLKQLIELRVGRTTLMPMPYEGFVTLPMAHLVSVLVGFGVALVVSVRASSLPSLASAACVWAISIATPASADDTENALAVWTTRPTTLELHAGFGTPVGYLGAMVDHAPLPWLSFCGGLGVGSGRSGGSLHLATGTRARLVRNQGEAWYVEVDYATGGWRRVESDIDVDFTFSGHGSSSSSRDEAFAYSERMHWLHGSVGVETRSDSGATFRAYVGAAEMLNPASRRCGYADRHRTCTRYTSASLGPTTILIVGLAFGFAV